MLATVPLLRAFSGWIRFGFGGDRLDAEGRVQVEGLLGDGCRGLNTRQVAARRVLVSEKRPYSGKNLY